MKKSQSEKISIQLANAIANAAPVLEYDRETAERWFFDSPSEFQKLIQQCEQDGSDLETMYVVWQFCKLAGVDRMVDRAYLTRLFRQAKKCDSRRFFHDPYINLLQIPDVRVGKFALLNVVYDCGEIFQYDMPDLASDIIVPKLGFFENPVTFPGLYEGNLPWMSVCPSEINSMREPIADAQGRVLTLGLGLGYFPFRISEKDSVSEIVVVEKSREIIRIFEEYLFPKFPHKEKIRVIEDDAFSYLQRLQGDEFDFCFADIWEGAADGAPAYLKIRTLAERLPDIPFSYWIEREILWYLEKE